MLKEKCDVITSKNTFGFELELDAPSSQIINDTHRDYQRAGYSFVHDGSMVGNHPIEVVSPVLSGKEGAKSVVDVCSALKSRGFTGNNPSMSLHVHIGGSAFKAKKKLAFFTPGEFDKMYKEKKDEIKDIIFVNKDVCGSVDPSYGQAGYGFIFNNYRRGGSEIERIRQIGADSVLMSSRETLKNAGDVEYDVFSLVNRAELRKIDDTCNRERRSLGDIAISSAEYEKAYMESITRRDRDTLELIQKGKGDGKFVVQFTDYVRTEKLKKLLYFYTAFDSVFLNMVSPSRREGNSFCMPISESYTLDEIKNQKTMEHLMRLWYRVDSDSSVRHLATQRYEDSRYHNVNLHSLFGRHGTVEIRSHGGTVEADKVLLWVALHQHIVDMLAGDKVTIEKIDEALTSGDTPSLTRSMFDVIELPEHLQNYVKKLLLFFSDIKV